MCVTRAKIIFENRFGIMFFVVLFSLVASLSFAWSLIDKMNISERSSFFEMSPATHTYCYRLVINIDQKSFSR